MLLATPAPDAYPRSPRMGSERMSLPGTVSIVYPGELDSRVDPSSTFASWKGTAVMSCLLSTGRRLAPIGVLVLCLATLASCGPRGPKTYPVKGKVVTEKGEPVPKLAGSGIEIQSATEPNTRGFGV